MTGRLTLATAPTVEPITQAEAARQLRLSETTPENRPASPTVALISPAAAGNVNDGAHRYRVTFVTADGETEGGEISGSVTVADKTVNGKVTVSAIPLGSGAVTARKVYRTAAGGSTYLLLTTIANNTDTTYTDNTADASLGAEVPSANTTDDPYIAGVIQSARELVERDTGRALLTQEWTLTLDAFPCDGEAIRIPRPPLQTVDAITYVDENGDTQTVPSDDYVVDTSGVVATITLDPEASWPSTLDQRGAVTVEFTAGYGDARGDVPEALRTAVKLALHEFYVSPGESVSAGAEGYENAVQFYRIGRAA